jgi:predicted acylesterase/phospholipase RssA
MKIKALSGGAFKIPAILSASSEVYHKGKYRPDIIAGVSSGSIIAMVEALNVWHQAEVFVLDEEVPLRFKVFDKLPFGRNGKPTLGAALRLLRGCNHISSMGNLRKTLKQIFTPELFREWKHNAEAPQVVVLAVNMTTGSRRGFWLKSMVYDKAIEAIMASCAFPGFAAPVEIDGELWHDGGIRNHSPGAWLVKRLEDPIPVDEYELVSIYSRPHDFQSHSLEWDNNFFTTVLRAFEIMEYENSKKDELLEEEYVDNYTAICIDDFLPEPFNDNPELLMTGYHFGIDAYNKYYSKPKPETL